MLSPLSLWSCCQTLLLLYLFASGLLFITFHLRIFSANSSHAPYLLLCFENRMEIRRSIIVLFSYIFSTVYSYVLVDAWVWAWACIRDQMESKLDFGKIFVWHECDKWRVTWKRIKDHAKNATVLSMLSSISSRLEML